MYIRLSEPMNETPVDLDPNGLTMVRRGRGAVPVVIAVGPMLDRVISATTGLNVTVLYAATVRPFDGEGLSAALEGPEVVLVEPYLAGTSAGEVGEALIATPHRLLSLGVPRTELRRYGTASEHDAAHGLDAPGLRAQLVRFFEGASVA